MPHATNRVAVAAFSVAALLSSPPPALARDAGVATTEVQHSIHARFDAANDWRGTVTVDQTLVRQGRVPLRRSGEISFAVWRRVCDIGGCIETVVAGQRVPVESSSWAGDLARGWVKASQAEVSVIRYRVDDEALTQLDSRAAKVPLVVSITRRAEKFNQTLTAQGQGISTASRTQQVIGFVTLRLDNFRLTSELGSAVLTNILTTMTSPRTPGTRR
ncbi:MAG: hypothetical protein EB027_03430 [Actinobacteria bacterium]|nr:hypothetical protein [Actinomycetota bacterium]